MKKRIGRVARGIYRQLKPHVRGRKVPREQDFSLSVPFGYDVSAAPAPDSTLAVVCHLFYPDLAGELRETLTAIPYPVDVFVSTDTDAKRRQIADAFATWRGRLEIRLLPNRGRDIAPKLVGFRDVFDDHGIVLLLHGKKTPDFDKGEAWRRTLTGCLVGSPDTVRSILEIFRLDPAVGMVICQHFEPIRRFIGWHHNFAVARRLARRMGVTLTSRHEIDMPSGSMFWTRSAAIRPLLDLGLTIEDFPEERGQTNGTLAHAIERLFLFACEAAGYRWVKVADRGLFEHQATIAGAASPDDVRRFVDTKARRLLAPGDRRAVRPSP